MRPRRSARPLVVVAALLSTLVTLPAAAGAGACCFMDTSCQDVAGAAECGGLGGVFLPGAVCADTPCAPGACCSEVGCFEIDAWSCIASGRDFTGAGIACADDPCDIGVGACCIDAVCSILERTECADGGGTFLGPGTPCGADPCAAGACCLGQTCSDGARFECDDLGGTFFEGADCAADPCTPPNDCPPDTLFAQQRDGPDDFIAGTSESSAGLQRFENFTSVAGPIETVTFWGLDLAFADGAFVECEEIDPTFRVSFSNDAAGEPGGAVASMIVTATRTPLGISYLGAELNQYTAVLPQPVVLVHGWISIVGLGDPDCWFLWMSAGDGDSYCAGCTAPFEGYDLALCLQGTAGGVFGACCTDDDGVCADAVEITDCLAPDQRFVPDTACADLDPPCGVILGACCFADATCTVDEEGPCAAAGGAWLGATSICTQCPCIAPCPAGGVDEGEPVCGDDYVDVFNGGCTADAELFAPITPGVTVCGTGGIYDSGPGEQATDLDWYELAVGQHSELRFIARAEYIGQIWIIDGSKGCPGEIVDTVAAFECDELSLVADVAPGTYWLVIGAVAFSDSSACGARYTATVFVTALCDEDLDDDGVVGFNDLLAVLAAWGPCGVCPEDLDGDGTVDFGELLQVLSAWGPC